MLLSELNNGDEFIVARILLDREIGKRLADMGFTKNAKGKIIRSALLGDPLQINILGYNLSLRKAEAAGVEITKL